MVSRAQLDLENEKSIRTVIWSRPSTTRAFLHLLVLQPLARDCDTSEPHRGPSALVHPVQLNQALLLAQPHFYPAPHWPDRIAPALSLVHVS